VMHSFILIRKEKIDSENELNITRVYGAAWQITLLVTYIMICIGTRNLDGSQSLLKLLQMIIHLGDVSFRIMFVCHQNAMIAGDTVINRKYLKVVYFPTYCEYLSFEGVSVTDTCGYIQPFYFLNLLLVSMSCQVSIFV
jgi:hypothetical protein